MADNTNYLFRITVLSCLALLAPSVSRETLLTSIMPVVLARATDPVPNVRFNVAKVLSQLAGPLSEGEASRAAALECLATLATDADSDVQFFAAQALAAYQA